MYHCHLEEEEQNNRICGSLIHGEVDAGEKGGSDLDGRGKAYWVSEAEEIKKNLQTWKYTDRPQFPHS